MTDYVAKEIVLVYTDRPSSVEDAVAKLKEATGADVIVIPTDHGCGTQVTTLCVSNLEK